MYMLCTAIVVHVHVLFCDSRTCTCFALLTVVRIRVLHCDSGTREKKFEKHCYTVYGQCRPKCKLRKLRKLSTNASRKIPH